jgi:hypothetical protein
VHSPIPYFKVCLVPFNLLGVFFFKAAVSPSTSLPIHGSWSAQRVTYPQRPSLDQVPFLSPPARAVQVQRPVPVPLPGTMATMPGVDPWTERQVV